MIAECAYASGIRCGMIISVAEDSYRSGRRRTTNIVTAADDDQGHHDDPAPAPGRLEEVFRLVLFPGSPLRLLFGSITGIDVGCRSARHCATGRRETRGSTATPGRNGVPVSTGSRYRPPGSRVSRVLQACTSSRVRIEIVRRAEHSPPQGIGGRRVKLRRRENSPLRLASRTGRGTGRRTPRGMPTER